MPSSSSRSKQRRSLHSTPSPVPPVTSRPPSRLRSLLALLLVSTTLLLCLQAFRARSSLSYVGQKYVAPHLKSLQFKLAQRTGMAGTGYMPEGLKVEERINDAAGMAVVPGSRVIDHPVGGKGEGESKEPAAIDPEDIKELDMDTLRAMLDTVYGHRSAFTDDDDEKEDEEQGKAAKVKEEL